jgi:hypothetical protein
MASTIHSVEIVEGLVEITVSKVPADGKFPIRCTAGAAETWAREILVAVDKLKRADVENRIASLKRQAQQVQSSLDDAEAQLRAMDAGKSATHIQAATTLDRVVVKASERYAFDTNPRAGHWQFGRISNETGEVKSEGTGTPLGTAAFEVTV